jgi:hypothetical protein
MAEDSMMEIINAYYINNAKDKMEVHYKLPEEGDAVFIAQTPKDDKENSLWQLVKKKYNQEKLLQNTTEHIMDIEEKRQRKQKSIKSNQVEKENDLLFKAKLEVFEMEEIKSSKNRAMKSKIRKAESVNQVYVYAGALVAIELHHSH